MAVIGRFLGDKRGNFALMVSLLAPLLFGVVGLSVDFSIFLSQKSRMQETADEAALAAVREAALQGWSAERAQAVADEFVSANLAGASMAGGVYRSQANVDEQMQAVTVSIRQDGHGYFLLGMLKSNPQIGVSAQAVFAAKENICLLALDDKDDAALNLSGISSVRADNCAVFSNSVSPEGLRVRRGAKLTASMTCTSGGYSGSLNDIRPAPITDCPPVVDPLAGRKAPGTGYCSERKLKISEGKVLLRPGTYCGGIIVNGNAVVTLLPGEYVIRDGPLVVSGSAMIAGENVGFYLTGKDAVFGFGPGSTLSLTAPKRGALAGILFFEDRASPKNRVFEMASRNATRFIGTVYLSRGKLVVSKSSRLGISSAWTAIVVNRLEVHNGPEIALNTDYSRTDIPVPEGIGGDNGTPYLRR